MRIFAVAGCLAALLPGRVPVLHAGETAAVSQERIERADPREWLEVGRTPDEQRYSPLAGIDTTNVARLGLAWFADFDTNRGQEATPLMIDGVIYLSTAWSKVKAFDARSGRLLWSYDPKVPGQFAGHGCCDVVNRGLAAWRGKIYVASYDGRLIALDARTGAVRWSVLTLDQDQPVTITGAPRVANGKILIGNAGGEFGVRGYLSAYDAETGRRVWRVFTVPGDPSKGFESAAMARAAKTWHGEWWHLGGGGTVWDGILYDPKLNRVYFGTGNGSPWNRAWRGTGGGDNLYIASILAVDADTGAYVWHYQESPGDEWDYDATSPLMTADLPIGGRIRHVLMQAGKNGFFYVLDARSGRLLSAEHYVPVNWATGIERETGRPIVSREARYETTGRAATLQPGGQGAHAWHPMSFSRQTGLVYFSAVDTVSVMQTARAYVPRFGAANTGLEFRASGGPPRRGAARLIAWDPVHQREAWHTEVLGWIGAGTLATGGGLVFQGTTAGRFVAYDARDGKPLWSFPTQTGVVAAPSAFELDGQEYIAEEVGYGLAPYGVGNGSRLLVFRLDGKASLPAAPPPPPPPVLDPPPLTASPVIIALGREQFQAHCAVCHDPPAANRSVFPDLRYSRALASAQAFDAIVRDGALEPAGMASFKARMSDDEIQAVRAYLIERANAAKAARVPAAGARAP